ncbi:hypothetical protein [Parerythrobacter aestuarii]|uniref:hypothetical protein n=1 Tax=Parerythrobacter aestuarii TaxID=3020909 RepID=UPI0024DE536F|nr:hypothetical protein [Parerythrobacter aestuarii]
MKHRSRRFTALVAPGIAAIVALQLVAPSVVQAQDSSGDDVELPTLDAYPASGKLAPASGYFENEGACRLSMVPRRSEASALGCAFEDTTLGFKLADTIELAGGGIGIEASFARGTSGAFALDHIMRGYRAGMNAEATLAAIGLDAKLLDGRLEWESRISWSREWEVPVADSPIRPLRLSEDTGAASEHRIKATLIDSPGVTWSVEGKYSTADAGYRPFYVSLPDRLFATEGETTRLDTRLAIDGWNLRAGFSTIDNTFLSSRRNALSVSKGGITARWTERRGQSSWTGHDQSGRWTETASRTYGLDVSTFELAPMLAMADEGFASLLPKTLTLELETKTIDRFDGGNASGYRSKGVSALGLWTTPIGDTIISFRNDRAKGSDRFGRSTDGSETFLLVSHTLYLGDWSVDLDYISNREASRSLRALRDGSNVGSFGVGARYARKGMPTIDLRIGRDTMDISSAEGALQLHDRSLRAEAEVNFTPWLQRKLDRTDMELRLSMRWDFDNSGYELALFDEIIDSEFEATQGRGALLTFVMQLQ